MAVVFKNMQLIIDSLSPDENILKAINSSITKNFRSDNISYIFTTEYNEEEKYLWIYAQYENYKIRNELVYDNVTYSAEENPRQNNQIEFKHQFFVLYSLENKTLYLSNLKKKELLANYLSDILQKEVIIKNYYRSMSDFSRGIKSLKNVSFVTKRNLFTEANGIFSEVTDIFGLDCTEELYIRAEYGRLNISDVSSNFFNRIESQKKKNQIENVIVCGYDDNDIERTLDINNYVESINVNVEPEKESWLLPNDDVRKALLSKLRELKCIKSIK